MKHIQIITPFKFQWLKGYKKIFEDWRITITNIPRPDTKPDVMMFMWADINTMNYINNEPKQCKYMVFIRRYEIFAFDMARFNWDKVDEIIMVNDVLAEHFTEITGRKPHIIYNGVIPEDWTYKERDHGQNIAWVGFINLKKNLPLALQIMDELSRHYHLHVAGTIQDTSIILFVRDMAKRLMIDNITFYGQIENMDIWLEDKNYLLSTAISEGCPNNVIEAMAKGIKPIIYSWPGAEQQFNGHSFVRASEAAKEITDSSNYCSLKYRNTVENKFGWNNFKKVRHLVEAL